MDPHRTDAIPNLTYLSYPRIFSKKYTEVYLYHLIHVAPDFDQVVIARFYNCTRQQDFSVPGLTWSFPQIPNVLAKRLQGNDNVKAVLIPSSGPSNQCSVSVILEYHCVVGPMFADRCDGRTEPPMQSM